MAQSRKITLYIFLFSLFLMLAMFIGIRMYNIYSGSRAASTEKMESTFACSFSFSVSNIEYSGSVYKLSLDLKTTDYESLKKIIIIDKDGNGREVSLGQFIGFEQHVEVEPILIEDAFTVFPEGCSDDNAKQCYLSSGKCSTIR